MSDTNNISSTSFLWEYTLDREELENQLERQIHSDEWYDIKDKLDSAIVEILSTL